MFGDRHVVLKALVGSHNYNLNTPSSDMDWKYFVMPTFDDLYLGKRFSSSSQSDKEDYDCHDIRQLPDLIWKANINFVEVLFSRNTKAHPRLHWLFYNADRLAQMNIPRMVSATLGMYFQKMSSLNKGTASTSALVDRFGYDTKQAHHALRCLVMLARLADGMGVRDALWFGNNDNQRQLLLDVKNGVFSRENFLTIVDHWFDFVNPRLDGLKNTPIDDVAKDELDGFIMEFVRDNYSTGPFVIW